MFNKLIFGQNPFNMTIQVTWDSVENQAILYVEFTVNDVINFNTYFAGFNNGDIIGSYELDSSYDFQQNTGQTIVSGGLTKISNTTFATDSYTFSYQDQLQYIVLDFSNYYSNNVAGDGAIVIQLTNPIINNVSSENQEPINNNISGNNNDVSITQIIALTDNEISTNFNIPIPQDNNLCFAINTKILTPNGYKLIQDLNVNDYIITGNNIAKKITKIIHYSSNNNNLYCIPKDSIDKNIPDSDLFITEYHAIKINNKYKHIKCLYNSNKYNIKHVKNDKYVFYNISTNDWLNDTIIVNNLECETLCTDIKLKWVCNIDECKYIIINKQISMYNLLKKIKKMKYYIY